MSRCESVVLMEAGVSEGFLLVIQSRTHPLIRVPRYWPFFHFMDGKSLI